MILPQVTTNGTARETLIEIRCDAARAIYDAIAALQLMGPHPRDYQGAPDGWFTAAQAVHLVRFTALEKMRGEIMAEAEALAGHL